jgi:DNA-binding beta-propeller fold protein YncE
MPGLSVETQRRWVMRKGLVVSVMVAVICIAGQVQAQITCTGTVFNDVDSVTQPLFCGWVELFSQLGITSGCAVNPPLYCPDDFVTRGQMAVFVTKATAVPFQKNPMQIALLKWYDAGQAATFPVGDAPIGIAFDGANIWVANFDSDNVTKLRASDGAHLGTFPVGDLPVGIAFDGASIWVANNFSDNVTKL